MKSIFLLLSTVLLLGCSRSVSPDEQRAFIERMVGGKEAYQTIAASDHVEAWLLTSNNEPPHEKKDRSGPKKLKPEVAKTFSEIFLNFNSYLPLGGPGKACAPDFGVRLQFTSGTNIVEFRFCFECDILEVTSNNQWPLDFDPSHNALVKAVQSVFPEDQIIKKLEIKTKRRR